MHFSIVMPTYNRASVVGDALRSVAKQHQGHDVEFVVVDDSTDDTLGVASRVLAEFPACRLVTHKASVRLGCTGARNRGIDLATGDVCVFLDSDDELTPGALDSIRDVFDTHSNIDAVFGAVATKSRRPPRREASILDRVISYEQFVVNERLGEFLPVVRRRVFLESGLRYSAELDGFESVLWRTMARRGYQLYFSSTVLRLYDDIGAERNCDLATRLQRAGKLARGHVFELREFGTDMRRISEIAYQKKVAKAAVYHRLADSLDDECSDFLKRANPILYRSLELVPIRVVERVFMSAGKLSS